MERKKSLLVLLYQKLFKINDTPQKIAFGLGIGIFSGIFPGTGPVAALFLATALRANRASALAGSLLTNTWLSVATFIFSIKLGSSIMRINWQDAYLKWRLFLKNFHFIDLLKLPALKLILPVILGYFIVALFLGILSYLITLRILFEIKRARRIRV